ncbi:MAG TPA: AAA family ATPase [Candidatus Polarisedimenticolia bacterium]|jgi:pilus assembly protein CpaE|nr:AAA family ATPase [Candidatus Polarisedimenticolia bacterium]
MTPKTPFSELLVLSDRPAFLAEIRQALGGAEGISVTPVDGTPRPGSLAACLAALDARRHGILLVDAHGDASAALLLAQAVFDHRPGSRVFLAGAAGDPDLILRALRAGAAEYLPLPVERRSLMEAILRLWRRLSPETPGAAPGRGKILTFLGSKGGCGTTTLSANLAVTLAARGSSTLLVDLDFTGGDAAMFLNLTPAFTVADVVQNAHRLDRDLLGGMVVKHVSGVEMLAAGEDPLRSRTLEPARIGQVLAFCRDHYEHVVVNTRETDDPITQAAVSQADLIHLVTCLDFLALRRAQWSLRRLARFGISRDVIRLVVNRYEKNPYISLEEAEKILDIKAAWTVPLDLKTAQEALNDGIPFVTRSRNGILKSFESYAENLLPAGRTASPPAAPRRSRWFGSRASARPSEGGATA